jgi:hypothetical protein
MNQPRISRTESWMTCKGQFFCRCKKPHSVISSRVCRSQKERSFRQVRPSCKLLHLTIFETIAINNHSYGIAPVWLAGENIYLGESALHVDNSVTLSSMNNGGDAGNRNPRRLSSTIPFSSRQPFRHSSSASNVLPIPQFSDERSRGRTKSVPTVKKLKCPHWTHVVREGLEVAVLTADVETLVPRDVAGVLRRTPIVVSRKTTNTRLPQIGIHQHHFTN